MIPDLLLHTKVISIIGDILTIRAEGIGLGELAIVEFGEDEQSLAQVIEIKQDEVALQVFAVQLLFHLA